VSQSEDLFRAIIPEGGHLASSKKVAEAFLGAVLSNETNQVIDQAVFVKVDKDSAVILAAALGVAAGLAAGVTATVVVVKRWTRIKSWWIGDARPKLRFFFGHKRTADMAPLQLAASVEIDPLDFSAEVADVLEDSESVMSSVEAQQRFAMMLLAAAFAMDQLRALNGARLESEVKLVELKQAMSQLSTEEVVDLVNRMLEAEHPLLDEDVRAVFVQVFGGGGEVDGKYVPLRREMVEEALKPPTPEVLPAVADQGGDTDVPPIEGGSR
jgi:hypothetical protein